MTERFHTHDDLLITLSTFRVGEGYKFRLDADGGEAHYVGPRVYQSERQALGFGRGAYRRLFDPLAIATTPSYDALDDPQSDDPPLTWHVLPEGGAPALD